MMWLVEVIRRTQNSHYWGSRIGEHNMRKHDYSVRDCAVRNIETRENFDFVKNDLENTDLQGNRFQTQLLIYLRNLGLIF